MTSPSDSPLLEARGLVASVRGDDGAIVRVLDDVSLDVPAGTVIDVLGPSGSGKSTLLRAIAWLLPDSAGSLSLAGEPATRMGPVGWRKAVALAPQKPALADGSVSANLALPWSLHARRGEHAPDPQRMRDALDAVGLTDVAPERDVARLSVGQQARVAFARTLLAAPRVLLLDEPDAALDPESSALVSAAVRRFAEQGGAVVRVRHGNDDGLASRRLHLAAGRLEEAGR